MKTLVVLVVLSLAACRTETPYGPCIGVADEKRPELVYETSAWNIAMAVIFAQTIVVPIVVVASEVSCPVAQKIVTSAP